MEEGIEGFLIMMGGRSKNNPATCSVEEARRLVLGHVNAVAPEVISIENSCGRILFDSVFLSGDKPSHAKSLRDGYAVRRKDIESAAKNTPVVLKVNGEVKAGDAIPSGVSSGKACRVMTGALLPLGSGAVICDEDVRIEGDTILVSVPVDPGQFIQLPGSEGKKGDMLCKAGDMITPMKLNILADCGFANVKVYSRPRIGILVTGNEVVELGVCQEPHTVYCNNRHFLAELVRAFGGIPVALGICGDKKEDLAQVFQMNRDLDVLVVTGGTGGGIRDLVKSSWLEQGGELLFDGVRMHPGKGTASGWKDHQLFFAFPGNPLAAGIAFVQFMAPALLKMCGCKAIAVPEVKGKITDELTFKRKDRAYFAWAKTTWTCSFFEVNPLVSSGGPFLTTISSANSIIRVQPGTEKIEKGNSVHVQLLHPGLMMHDCL